ncbi:MAG TPA: sigma-70 family RNA polymerase sigma factor [Tepidisphaeraceae bacterium]|nr:sigma-70 family RNA polymerase sigma factor [Tepidisphaeraceae bacterium]
MNDLTQAERYLLEQTRQGSPQAWEQLVDRYQGRLLAFARSRAVNRSDAEDLVQETFMQFLKGLPGFREEASLETWLFMILRRRIVDLMRGRRVLVCDMQESRGDEESGGSSNLIEVAAPDLTASAYARRDERLEHERNALSESLAELISGLKEAQNFRDLKIIEMLFYGQIRNKDIAKLAGLDEKNIALIKHRWLKQLRQRVAQRLKGVDLSAIEEPGCADSLLTEIWEEQRLSCPKRSTVGGYLLNTLEPAWHEYVEFHIQKLGCRFCRANLEDLQAETQESPRAMRDRIMESTVGFFRKS